MEQQNQQTPDTPETRLAQIQVWYVSEILESGRFFVMLRQRNAEGDRAQNKFGVPCAGWAATAESFEQALTRLLAEQLERRRAEECLLYFGLSPEPGEADCRIYLLLGMTQDTPYLAHAKNDRFQWIDAEELLQSLKAGDARYSTKAAVVEQIIRNYTGIRNYTIHVTDPWSAPSAGSYAGSDEWVYDETYEFFGSLKAAMEEGAGYVYRFRSDVSPYLASVVYWLT